MAVPPLLATSPKRRHAASSATTISNWSLSTGCRRVRRPLPFEIHARCYIPNLEPCPFCPVPRDRIWIETEHAIAFADAYPVADGHTLVIPRKHVVTIYELTIPEQTAIWELVGEVRERLLTGLKPDGFNIGFNDGLAAGQTVMHAHVHRRSLADPIAE